MPLFGCVLVQRTFRPLARRRLKIALPPVVLILMRKPWVRANDFRDLFLLVWQRANFLPALTTRPRRFPFPVPALDIKSNPSDNPEYWATIWDQIILILTIYMQIKQMHQTIESTSHKELRAPFSSLFQASSFLSMSNYSQGINGKICWILILELGVAWVS